MTTQAKQKILFNYLEALNANKRNEYPYKVGMCCRYRLSQPDDWLRTRSIQQRKANSNKNNANLSSVQCWKEGIGARPIYQKRKLQIWIEEQKWSGRDP